MQEDDPSSAYRTLGISDDASYDEITEAYIALTENYAGNNELLARIESAKESVLSDRLSQRLQGTLKPVVADSPWDEKPIERIPPWVIAADLAQNFSKYR